VPAISDAVRRFAEDPEAFIGEIPLPARRIARPSFTLVLSPSPTQSTVSRVATSPLEIDATVAEVRRLAREAGYTRTAWSIGPSARPQGLVKLLTERGFIPATRAPLEPELAAMALIQPPPPAPAGVEARPIRSLDEYRQALRIGIEAFGETEEDAVGWLAAAPELWKQQDGVHRFAHLAFVDGRPVGFAMAAVAPEGLLLGGSGVLSSARGRGAYRALLAARWESAVGLGTPVLVIQAGAMSRPILERCGFEQTCRIDVLDDPAAGRAA
jgi:GNAT superfamily N-acetyltransferase